MPRRRINKRTLKFLADRAAHRCEYCQSRADCSADSFETEHILPIALGGTDDLENLAFACRGCNARKSQKTQGFDAFTQQLAPLFNPRTEDWSRHFAWDNEFLKIFGLTPTGRATVSALQLNRPGVVNLRYLMKLSGVHPPKFG